MQDNRNMYSDNDMSYVFKKKKEKRVPKRIRVRDIRKASLKVKSK